MNIKSTIIVKSINEMALLMQWEATTNRSDITAAYSEIQRVLEQATSPMYVIVDLTQNPQMPMRETLTGALFGPYGHPMLAQWLVVGKHNIGLMVARLLERTTGKKQVTWFNTIDAALEFVTQQQQV
jgi:hypothetical protein